MTLGEASRLKAGAGDSIPSLATIVSTAYKARSRPFRSSSFQNWRGTIRLVRGCGSVSGVAALSIRRCSRSFGRFLRGNFRVCQWYGVDRRRYVLGGRFCLFEEHHYAVC
jgi:hypothetical protein